MTDLLLSRNVAFNYFIFMKLTVAISGTQSSLYNDPQTSLAPKNAAASTMHQKKTAPESRFNTSIKSANQGT
jgi:hypothetical protein